MDAPVTALAFHPGAVLTALLFGGLLFWFLWRWARRSEDAPLVLMGKIILTLLMLAVVLISVWKIHPIMGVVLGATAGVFGTILWGSNIGSWFAGFFTGIFDGGSAEPDRRPFYAVARAHEKQARYAAAIAAIEAQLKSFPDDVEGLLLLAEIQARRLGDWTSAAATVERVAGNEALPVPVRARALQALADWRLDDAGDSAGAREIFRSIVERFPDTAESREASQRLARMGDGVWRPRGVEPARLAVPKGEDRLGLRVAFEPPPAPSEDPVREAARLCQRLSEHPQDIATRERLAGVYAEGLNRLDLAVAELESLIAEPLAPPKSIARWLHLIADLEMRHGTEAGARAALSRIAEMFPNTALAAAAQSRLEHLKLELRSRKPTSRLRSPDSH
jgi:tetratricopeptide (TPR) repeat protein